MLGLAYSAMPVICGRLAGFRSEGSARNLRSFEGKGQLGSRFPNPTNTAKRQRRRRIRWRNVKFVETTTTRASN